MIWNAHSEYPGVCVFAQNMKDATMRAHNAIIAARMKSTHVANHKWKEAPFVKGDLVYLSTENLSLPKGRARKLSPKFIGPFKILEDYRNNSYLLDLPADLKQRGLHPAFHAHLLRIHVPNDDHRFPGWQLNQIADLGTPEEWSISRIVDHNGQGTDSLFEVEYSSGDKVWLPYHEVSRLEAVGQYLETLGVPGIQHLPKKISRSPPEISVASAQVSTDGPNDVFQFVDRMLKDIANKIAGIEPEADGIEARPSQLTNASIPRLSSSPMAPPAPDSSANSLPVGTLPAGAHELGEVVPDTYSRGHCSGRQRGWRGRRSNPSYGRESNSDALNTFTRFFRAEAQAKELATRKEAHAFDQQVKAECHCERTHLSHHTTNQSLDNRTHRRAPPPRVPPSRTSASSHPHRVVSPTPDTVAQVIAAAISANPQQTPKPAPPAPTTLDEGPDVLNIVAATEQMDIDAEAQFQSSFFGRVAMRYLPLVNLLILLYLVAAFGGPQQNPSTQLLASPAPSA
jgi:hypothetical protein